MLELCNEVYVRAELLGLRDTDTYKKNVLRAFARGIFGWQNVDQLEAGAHVLEMVCTASVEIKRSIFWV